MEPNEYALMNEAEARMWWYRALHARLLDALGSEPDAPPILDAGCGTGGFLRVLDHMRPSWEAFGLEWHEPAAHIAAAKTHRSIARGSIDELPFAERAFGTVIAADVLCHAAVEPPRALAEISRVLRPGGRLIVNMPAFRSLMSAHDARVHNARRMNARETRTMLEDAGFRRPPPALLEQPAAAADDRATQNPRPVIAPLRCRRFSAMAGPDAARRDGNRTAPATSSPRGRFGAGDRGAAMNDSFDLTQILPQPGT